MFALASARQLERRRWLLRVCVASLPLPWIAAELGWYVAEGGRQPWTIDGVLPTFLSVSDIPAADVQISLVGLRGLLLRAADRRAVPDGAHHPPRPAGARPGWRRRQPPCAPAE